MTTILMWFTDVISDFYDFLCSITFTIFGFEVSLGVFFVAAVCLTIAFNVLWKGAKG